MIVLRSTDTSEDQFLAICFQVSIVVNQKEHTVIG